MGVFLLAVCGFLIGGTWSLARQRRWLGAAIVGAAAVLAGVAAGLWLVGD